MRKFTQPVSMQVTKEQYERDLKEPLIALEYNPESSMAPKGDGLETVATNFYEKDSDIGYIFDSRAHNYGRHFIDHYNPELFLALAAMSEGDYQLGEIITYSNDYLYKIVDTNKWVLEHLSTTGQKNAYNTDPNKIEYFSRPSKERIIEHFTKNKKSMSKQAIPFVIYGKPHQLEAINKDLIELGFEQENRVTGDITSICQQTDIYYHIIKDRKEKSIFAGTYKSEGSKFKTFQLPQDYQAALDHANTWVELFKPKDIIINGYNAKFDIPGAVSFGCKTITKEQLLALKSSIELYNKLGGFSIHANRIKGIGVDFTEEVKLDMIDQLLEKLK